MKKIILSIFFLFVISISSPYKLISPEDVKTLIDNGVDFVLIDDLTPIHYAVEHIPNALNIPEGAMIDNKGKPNKYLPEDKTTPIVFYCMDPKCIFSKNNAKTAIKMGYKNVSVMEAGIKAWKALDYPVTIGTIKLPSIKPKAISPQQLKAMGKKVQIVNLLENIKGREFIKGSINVPITDIIYSYKRISKRKPVVLYSLHGKVDQIAAKYLVAVGYKKENISYLKGGIEAWKAAGFKTKTY